MLKIDKQEMTYVMHREPRFAVWLAQQLVSESTRGSESRINSDSRKTPKA